MDEIVNLRAARKARTKAEARAQADANAAKFGRSKAERALEAAREWAAKSDADADLLESLRARAAIASVAVLSGQGDVAAALRVLLAAVDANGEDADGMYPPTSTEIRLYVGLLAAHRGDAGAVAEMLRRTRDSRIVRDYPTVAQLQQVLLAEQDRLAGKPQAAIDRLPGEAGNLAGGGALGAGARRQVCRRCCAGE